MVDVLATPSRADMVAKALEAQVVAECHPPGHLLGTKDELQRRFGVARATLNEAVRLLHDRGIVETKSGPRGGVFVTRPDAGIQLGRFLVSIDRDVAAVSDQLEIRDHLEILLARHAALAATEDKAQSLRSLVDDLAAAEHSEQEQMRCIFALHDKIADLSANRTLVALYKGLLDNIRQNVDGAARHRQGAPEEFFARRTRVHRQLVEAIISGDPDRAEAAARSHNE